MNVKEETNRGSIVERQHMRAVEADARHESEAGNNLRWPMEKKKMCGPPVTVTVRLEADVPSQRLRSTDRIRSCRPGPRSRGPC